MSTAEDAAAEREANGSESPVARHSHGRQHMRRGPWRRSSTTSLRTRRCPTDPAGTTGPRPRRRRSSTWALPATFRSRPTVSVTPSTFATRPSTSRSRKAATRSTDLLALVVGECHRCRERHDAADVLRAAAATPLLSTAEHHRLDAHALAHHERADALGSTELVAAQTDQLGRSRTSRRRPARRTPGWHRCAGRRSAPARRRPRRRPTAAGWCRPRC